MDTAYADDLHYSWLVTSSKALEKAYNQMKAILKGLGERGLTLSMEKTVILISLGGPQAKACLHRYTVPHPDTKRPCLRFHINGKQTHIQVVSQQLYLGIQIGYGRFEQQTFAYRQQLAKHTNTRLAPVLKCRSLPCHLRLRLWQSTAIPTMLHGLDCVGLPNTTAETMWTQFFKQSRSIANSHSMFTRESNQAFALRLRLPDPIRRLLECVARRDRADQFGPQPMHAGSPQVQWRELVRGQLVEAGALCVPHNTGCRMQFMVQDVLHEQFRCSECEQAFATQAALRRHVFREHMTEDQQDAKRLDNRRQVRAEIMEHARDGMPECRHCGYKFTTCLQSHQYPKLLCVACLEAQSPQRGDHVYLERCCD